MKILVTGATGRVGANLAKALLEKGYQVRAFIYHCEIAYEKAHRLLGYQPKHGVKSMLDLALAMREGRDMGLIPTGIPYGQAE